MAAADPHTLLLAETVARHFPDARLDGADVDLGFAGLRAHCRVNQVREHGGQVTASLFLWFSGGPFGAGPIFASASGYGRTPEEAILTGGCQWTCTFGPVFRAAFTGAAPSESMETREVTVHGQRMRLFIDGLDRALLFEAYDTPLGELMRASRRRLAGDRWLSERLIEAGSLPLLASGRPTLLSVFCADHPTAGTLEVKVDGCDWPSAAGAFADRPASDEGLLVALREIAVLVPLDPAPPLSRSPLARTLAGLAMAPRRSTSWRGWAAHVGHLDEPLGADALARVEADLGPLPEDYRAFLRDVAAGGAGPGYGLLRPDHPAQPRLATGVFPYREDTDEAEEQARGVLALAHAGCAVVWILVLRGPRRGEVWVDAGGSDHGMRRVAASFSDWYRDWLSACTRDAFPWLQWDSGCCASPSVLSQVLTSVEEREGLTGEQAVARLPSILQPGSLALASGGGAYFAAGDAIDPCAGCVALFDRLGLDEGLFPPGLPPLQGRTASARPGLFRRLLGKA
jgi:hypothetical protein